MDDPLRLIDHLAGLDDPRNGPATRYLLIDIVVVAICAVICGAGSWRDIEAYGLMKKSWFQTFLALPNGIPSHDTFARVFARIDPQRFQECLLSWIRAVGQLTKGKLVAIDGKTLRRSFDKAAGKAVLHLVSAWCSKNQLVLGQVKVDAKSNEITAIPRLLHREFSALVHGRSLPRGRQPHSQGSSCRELRNSGAHRTESHQEGTVFPPREWPRGA